VLDFLEIDPRATTGRHRHRVMMTGAVRQHADKVAAARGVTLRTEYLAAKLTPYPLPTKDAGVLRTIGDARAYMQALPKTRALRAHWQHASRLLLEEVRPTVLTRRSRSGCSWTGSLTMARSGI
jgi:hypothetical protein